MEFVPLGDSALVIRLETDFRKSPEHVLDALRELKSAQIPGVVDLAPAYATIALFFDPIRLVEAGAPREDVFGWLIAKIEKALSTRSKRKRKNTSARLVEIPVCYEDQFAPDLTEVAARAKISSQEVVQLHSGGDYRVECVGFTPGFGYLSGLDARLTTPRRASPRIEVAAGSVAIGGAQTGVYPLRSPGGWNIIGRTPRRMFDVNRDPPALLQVGDRVRFRAVTRTEFDSLGA
jgi:inhibitor of KinA